MTRIEIPRKSLSKNSAYQLRGPRSAVRIPAEPIVEFGIKIFQRGGYRRIKFESRWGKDNV